MIEAVLKETTDTKACRLGPGVTEQVGELFTTLFSSARRARIVQDVNTPRVPYMWARYCGLGLVSRLGLYDKLEEKLFGVKGIWAC